MLISILKSIWLKMTTVWLWFVRKIRRRIPTKQSFHTVTQSKFYESVWNFDKNVIWNDLCTFLAKQFHVPPLFNLFRHRYSTTHFLSFNFTIQHSIHKITFIRFETYVYWCFLSLPTTLTTGLQACSVAFAVLPKFFYRLFGHSSISVNSFVMLLSVNFKF